MIIPLRLNQRYYESSVVINELQRIVRETINNYCESNNYAFSQRKKTLGSLAEKIETGRYKSWSQLDDLFASTIIVPTLEEEKKVINDISKLFKVIKMTKRGQYKKAPEMFRFESPRIICTLIKPAHLGEVDAGMSIYSMPFEIQVRTAFEHAWSVTSHMLTYKTDLIDWKRTRIVSQVKAIVEQLDCLIAGFQDMVPNIIENPWPEYKAKKAIAESIKTNIQEKIIPEELNPQDMSRFCDNLYTIFQENQCEEKVPAALSKIRDQLVKMTPDKIPRSLSLLQLYISILNEQDIITCKTGEYIYHVTPEMVELFPKTKNIDRQFDYES